MILRSPILALTAVLAVSTPLPAQRLKIDAKIENLEATARADSNDAAAHFNLGLGYWSHERYDEAEESLRLATQIDPMLAEAYLALAYLPYARRSELWEEIEKQEVPEELVATVEESDRLYRRAVLIDPLVDLRIIGAVRPGKSIYWEVYPDLRWLYEMFFEAFDDLFEGKYDRAYFKLQRLIDELDFDRDPNHTPDHLLWYHALAAAHIERYDEAIRDVELLLTRSLDLERKDQLIHVPLRTNEYRYILAHLKQLTRDTEESVRLYREALESDLGLYMAHVQIARIYESQGRWLDASEECRRAINANPDDPSLLYALGVTLGRANRLGDSEEVLVQAMEANPRDARVPYVLGLVQYSIGKTDEARESFTHFIAIAPSKMQQQIADARRRLALLKE